MEIDDALENDLFGEPEQVDDEMQVVLTPMEIALDDPEAPKNREGHAVIRGLNEWNNRFYCGIMKGKKLNQNVRIHGLMIQLGTMQNGWPQFVMMAKPPVIFIIQVG